MLPLRALGENPSLPLPASDGCMHSLASLACGHTTPVCLHLHILSSSKSFLLQSVSDPPLLSVIPTLAIGFRVHPDSPGWSHQLKIFNFISSAKTLFQINWCQFQGLECEYLFWVATIPSAITHQKNKWEKWEINVVYCFRTSTYFTLSRKSLTWEIVQWCSEKHARGKKTKNTKYLSQ